MTVPNSIEVTAEPTNYLEALRLQAKKAEFLLSVLGLRVTTSPSGERGILFADRATARALTDSSSVLAIMGDPQRSFSPSAVEQRWLDMTIGMMVGATLGELGLLPPPCQEAVDRIMHASRPPEGITT